MPTIIPNARAILSVYPLNVEHYARHNGLITYLHPAAMRDSVLVREYNPERMSNSDPGKVPESEPMFRDTVTPCEKNKGYTLIRLYDTFTWQRDFTQDRERMFPAPLPAVQVAQSLVTSWASDVIEGNGSMGPGLMVIEGHTPTQAEIDNVTTRQTNYARTLINSARVLYAQDKVKDISGLHRSMAVWMGIQNVPWLTELEQVEMKNCRACGEKIRAGALRCKECNVDLIEFYTKHGIVPDMLEDPGVFAFMDKSTAAKKVQTKVA